jgi:hypothetical protein
MSKVSTLRKAWDVPLFEECAFEKESAEIHELVRHGTYLSSLLAS